MKIEHRPADYVCQLHPLDGAEDRVLHPTFLVHGEYIHRMPIHLPHQYSCDGFSVPCWLRWVAGGPWQKGWAAAVWHDFLREFCQRKFADLKDPAVLAYEREYGFIWWTEDQADSLFLAFMKMHGVSWWKRQAFFRAVCGERWLRTRVGGLVK